MSGAPLTATAATDSLSLADLQAFDPNHKRRDGETDCCCPLCGTGKPVDAAHRSLSYNAQTGAWNCHRCHAKGKLREFWTEAAKDARPTSRRDRDRQRIRRALQPPVQPVDNVDSAWKKRIGALARLQGTLGAAYLESRGLPADFCHAAGVRFASDFFGRPAVVFPLRGENGKLTAAQGRYVDGRNDPRLPRMRTAGARRLGVFATPGAWESAALVLVEAPIDALSLALCGVPAVALCGCEGLPDWLKMRCAFQTVICAFDADAAGDKAARQLAADLACVGAKVLRLRPDGAKDAKDWNALLQAVGVCGLCDRVADVLGGVEGESQQPAHLVAGIGPLCADFPADLVELGREAEAVLRVQFALHHLRAETERSCGIPPQTEPGSEGAPGSVGADTTDAQRHVETLFDRASPPSLVEHDARALVARVRALLHEACPSWCSVPGLIDAERFRGFAVDEAELVYILRALVSRGEAEAWPAQTEQSCLFFRWKPTPGSQKAALQLILNAETERTSALCEATEAERVVETRFDWQARDQADAPPGAPPPTKPGFVSAELRAPVPTKPGFVSVQKVPAETGCTPQPVFSLSGYSLPPVVFADDVAGFWQRYDAEHGTHYAETAKARRNPVSSSRCARYLALKTQKTQKENPWNLMPLSKPLWTARPRNAPPPRTPRRLSLLPRRDGPRARCPSTWTRTWPGSKTTCAP